MALKPINRESMRTLKYLKDEGMRQGYIQEIVETIYTNAVEQAMNTTRTVYRYEINNRDRQFYSDNMSEILEKLQNLFPSCAVKDVLMYRGKDRRTYGIDDMDEDFMKSSVIMYILVDWT